MSTPPRLHSSWSISHFTLFAYTWPLCVNTTSSTKPEVHNILQRRKRRNESQPTWTETLAKFGHVVFEICYIQQRKSLYTHRHAHSNTLQPFQGLIALPVYTRNCLTDINFNDRPTWLSLSIQTTN